MSQSLYDFSPLLRLLMVGGALAALPLLWIGLRRQGDGPSKLRALTLVTLFLTFDLVMFGAFTRLTDSGLGCPDWPGCYGHASPVGAAAHIDAAQTAMPTGPVTHGKAWVEMLHRYWASGVGALILVIAVAGWWLRRDRKGQPANLPSPWWGTATLVWVCVQGAFGALTVTMKLFPAIVSLHLLGGYVLLALLTVQAVQWGQHNAATIRPPLTPGLRVWMACSLLLLSVQAASGAWVSTNYAVLACTEFPQCQGQWWPDMAFAPAFELWRPLGLTSQGEHIPFAALTAIHVVHRLSAAVTVLVLAALCAALWRYGALKFLSRALACVLLLQLATGVSNAVLDWPLPAAVLHTGGAGALVVILVALLSRSAPATATTPTRRSLA
ncbi:MAG: heme A synthase [Burkholderiales bacterium PBB4]|nr:MAG: heme A synthase [Burkholderiales bacterium PBB4]